MTRPWWPGVSPAVRLRVVLVVVAVVTFAIRFVPLVASGLLGAEYGYDDGVHLSLAEHLIAVPAVHADDFEAYARANPEALPLLGRGEPGRRDMPGIADDLVIARDTGGYMVFRDG